MVRIPTYDFEGRLNVGSETFRPMDTDNAAKSINKGFQSVAAGFGTIADELTQEQTKQNKFVTQYRINEFAFNQQRDLEDKVNKGEVPIDGKGFADKAYADAKANADKLLESLPEDQRREAQLRLQGTVHDIYKTADGIEKRTNKEFISGIAKSTLDRVTNGTKSGLWDQNRANEEIEGFLKDSGLQGVHLEQFRNVMQKSAQLGRLEYLRSTNPEAFTNEFQKYLPNQVSDNAHWFQKAIAKIAPMYGLDVRGALITSQIESSNDFQSNWNRPTQYKGPFQLGTDERNRLARQLGVPAEKILSDPATAIAAFALLRKEQIARLEGAGVPATPEMIYASHLLGMAGAIAFYHAPPDTNGAALFAKLDPRAYNAGAFNGQQNPGLLTPHFTTKQTLEAISRFVQRGAAQVDKILVQNPNIDPKAPVSVGGETFDKLTAADVVPLAMKAREDVQKRMDATIQANQKKAGTDFEVANSYDGAWRSNEDKLHADAGQRLLVNAQNTQELAQWHKYAETTGYLPSSVVASARKMINMSGSPENQIKGYELLSTLAKADPLNGLKNAKVGGDSDSVGQNDAAKVRDYVNLTTHAGYGTDDQYKLQAIRQIERSHSEDWKVKDQRVKQDIDTQAKARTWDELSQARDMKVGRFANWWRGNGFVSTDMEPASEAVKNRMEDLYQSRFRFHYTDSGNVEIAKANAMADVFRSVGQTRVSGKPMMTPYPVENNYPPLGAIPKTSDGRMKLPSEMTQDEIKDNYGYIHEQAKAAVLSATGIGKNGKVQDLIPKELKGKIRDEDIIISANGNTRKDVEAGNVVPRYDLGVRIDGKYLRITDGFAADPQIALLMKQNKGSRAVKDWNVLQDATDGPSLPNQADKAVPAPQDLKAVEPAADKQRRKDDFKLRAGATRN